MNRLFRKVPNDYNAYWHTCPSCGAKLHPAEQPYCETLGCPENEDEQEQCQSCGIIGEELINGLCFECSPIE